MTETLLNLAPTILGIITGIGGGAIFAIGAWRRSKNAEAKLAEAQALMAEAQAAKAMKDLYEERIRDLHQSVGTLNDTEVKQAERIARLNDALDGKTDRIRTLTDQLYASEQGRNEDKDTITRLTAENGRLRVEVEHYKSWLCKEADCPHRQPPNPKIAGKKYTKPAQQ